VHETRTSTCDPVAWKLAAAPPDFATISIGLPLRRVATSRAGSMLSRGL
jgi:hypothetical protein